MTKVSKGIINPQKKTAGEMFVGWGPAPVVDRRFLLAALPAGLAASAGASWAIAKELDDPGAGSWLTNATHQVTGVLIDHPYPMIRLADKRAPFGMRTVLVVAQGKCTSGLTLKEVSGKSVTASGVLIQRKDRQMLEVPLFLGDWLQPSDGDVAENAALTSPQNESLGHATLSGTIMDSKCFFGVMKSSLGKTHKACASLCIRGGIPPSFWARTRDGRESVLLMTDAQGGPMPMDILPLVADPVTAQGEIIRVGDILEFRAEPDAYSRI